MRSSKFRRAGMTLLELVVVLTILVALAGIAVATLPAMVTHTHNASVSTNITQMNSFLQLYQATNFNQFPDQWDALSDGSNVIDYFAGGEGSPLGSGNSTTQVGGMISTSTLNSTELSNLAQLVTGSPTGSVHVHLMPATLAAGQALNASSTGSTAQTPAWSPTFNPYSTPQYSGTANTMTTLTTSTPLASITGTLANQLFGSGAAPTGHYIVLGIGSRSTLVGSPAVGIMEAPVVAADTPNLNPTLAYVRFVVCFQVSDTNNPSMSVARFVGTLEPDDDGFDTASKEINESWNTPNGQ